MVKANKGRWTPYENAIFNNAIKFGLTWKQVSKIIGTRTAEQCRSHNQKLKISFSNKKPSSNIMIDKEIQYEPQLGFTIENDTFLEPFDMTNPNEMGYPSIEFDNLYEEFL